MPTLSQCLCIAASTLPAEFTVEDLTVAAFRLYPAIFGMKKYPQYPDHHKAMACLCGKHGLVERGYLMREEPGVLTLGPVPVPKEWTVDDTVLEEMPAMIEPDPLPEPKRKGKRGVDITPTESELADYRSRRSVAAIAYYMNRVGCDATTANYRLFTAMQFNGRQGASA